MVTFCFPHIFSIVHEIKNCQYYLRIKFEISTKNGGKVEYEDRDKYSPWKGYDTKHYFIEGIRTHETLELGVDEYPPTHCFEINMFCPEEALNVADFLNQVCFYQISQNIPDNEITKTNTYFLNFTSNS